MKTPRDWATILKDYSSGEDSDEHDTLNVRTVQKNAHRVVDLLHSTLPGLDPKHSRAPPIGMNNADVIREGLSASIPGPSPHSYVSPASFSSTSPAASVPPPPPPPPSPASDRGEGVLV